MSGLSGLDVRSVKVTGCSGGRHHRAMDDITFPTRLTTRVPSDLANEVRDVADVLGLTVADYLRGALQSRLRLDGVEFETLPNLKRLANRPSRRVI